MPQIHNSSYNSNPLLKPCGTNYAFTLHEAQEYKKCKEDPIYFIENYLKVVTLDDGLVPLILHGYQREMITNFWKERFNIVLASRQSGKCLCIYTLVTIKNKDIYNGQPFSIKIGDFYEWQRFIKFYGDNSEETKWDIIVNKRQKRKDISIKTKIRKLFRR